MLPYSKQIAVLTVGAIALSGCMSDMTAPDGMSIATPQSAQPRLESLRPVVTQAPLCSAIVYKWLEGQPGSAAETAADPKRIIPAGSAVATDNDPSRTNFDLDESGVISRVWCG